MTGHLPSLLNISSVADHLGNISAERKAPHEQHAAFPQGRVDPVMGLEGKSRANARSFLPGAWSVKANAPLPLQPEELFIEDAAEEHVLKERQVLFPTERGHGHRRRVVGVNGQAALHGDSHGTQPSRRREVGFSKRRRMVFMKRAASPPSIMR